MVEAENLKTIEQNRALTTTFLEVTQNGQDQRDRVLRESGARVQLDSLEEETAMARSRWRIMKSVVGAIIAGSGVDWVGDDTLRDLVLDEEYED